MRSVSSWLTTLVILMATLGCGPDLDSSEPVTTRQTDPDERVPIKLEVTSAPEWLMAGTTERIAARVTYSNGDIESTVDFTVLENRYVEQDGAGIRDRHAALTTVEIEYQGLRDSFAVRIESRDPAELYMFSTAISLEVGGQRNLEFRVHNEFGHEIEDYEHMSVTFFKTDLVEIDGLVLRGVKAGGSAGTLTTANGVALDLSLTVTNPPIEYLKTSDTDPSMQVGETRRFTVTAFANNLNWQVEPESAWTAGEHVRTEIEGGEVVVHAVYPGQAEVSFEFRGVEGNISVHVETPEGTRKYPDYCTITASGTLFHSKVFDSNENVTHETSSGPKAYSIANTYDMMGRRTESHIWSITPSFLFDSLWTYFYDTEGRLSGISSDGLNASADWYEQYNYQVDSSDTYFLVRRNTLNDKIYQERVVDNVLEYRWVDGRHYNYAYNADGTADTETLTSWDFYGDLSIRWVRTHEYLLGRHVGATVRDASNNILQHVDFYEDSLGNRQAEYVKDAAEPIGTWYVYDYTCLAQ